MNRNGVKIAVPLKHLSNFWRSLEIPHLSNFWRSLEIPLIICKVELSFTWNPNCVLSHLNGDLTFTITDLKLYVPIVTLSIKGIAKLSKLLSGRFKRSVDWNKYKIVQSNRYNENHYIRELLD